MPRDILVYVEMSAGAVQSVSLEALSAARELAAATGGAVEAVVLGAKPKCLAALAAADRILSANDPRLEAYVPEAHLAVLDSVTRAREPAAVLLAYTTPALDLAPALAFRTGRPLLAYCTKLMAHQESVEAEGQIYSGKLRVSNKTKLPAILTIMPGAYPEAAADGRTAPPVEEIAVSGWFDSLRTSLVSTHPPPGGPFDLGLADKIICIGRGVGDKDGINDVRELAYALGAEIAGSRPIIDNGWLPKERQVGKSGRKVKPKLYFALGVSGAPEHLEGMRGADLIIAVNSDAGAPIFAVAHYGAAVDMFDLLPALAERMKRDGLA